MGRPPQSGVALSAAERQTRRRAKLELAAWIAAEQQRLQALRRGDAPTPRVKKPFPRQARSRAQLSAKDAAWLQESGSFFDQAASDKSWDEMDPKAYWLLRDIFGSTPAAVRVSAFVSMWFHARFTGQFEAWSLPDNKPEIPELKEFPKDARKMLPRAERLLEYWRAFPDRRVSKPRIRRYSDLTTLLRKCITDGPRKRSFRSDEWHTRARLYAKMIEDACHMAGVLPPTRNSTKSPLVLGVQGLLRLEGFAFTAEAVRKVLVKIRG